MEVRIRPEELDSELLTDARAGLEATPKSIPSRWFYDKRGSELFEAITRLPEYYLTGAERSILEKSVDQIADVTRPEVLIELGSGSSSKTRLLLSALRAEGSLRTFAPFDVDEDTLAESCVHVSTEYPGLEVIGIVGDFQRHIGSFPQGRLLLAFLGSTIGNLTDAERSALLSTLHRAMLPNDWLLIGVDLVKDRDVLQRAYNDSHGLTAEFNLNVLSVLNQRLGANFELPNFKHVAFFNEAESRIEMHLEATVAQTVFIDALGTEISFASGERLHTEISVKFQKEKFLDEVEAAGFTSVDWFEDERGWFALALFAR